MSPDPTVDLTLNLSLNHPLDLTLNSVIARHPGVPGMGLVLDPRRVSHLAALAGIIPPESSHRGTGSGYAVSRLRIKRNRSVSVGLRPTTGTGSWLLARATRPEDWATKAAKDVRAAQRRGLAAGIDRDAAVVVVPMMADRRLPLDRLHVGRSHREGVGAARTLSYNPGRRWVGVVDPAPAAGTGAPGRLLRVYAGQRRPVISAFVAGTPLDHSASAQEWALAGGPGEALAAELTEALSRGLAVRGRPPRRSRDDLVNALAATSVSLGDLHPEVRMRAGRVLRRISRHLDDLHLTSPAHGDFSPDQVIRRHDGGLHVIDWDRWGWWPHGWDAATWAARAVVEGVMDATSPPPAIGASPAPAVLAAAALLRCPDPFRRMRPDWPAATVRLLDFAEGAWG